MFSMVAHSQKVRLATEASQKRPPVVRLDEWNRNRFTWHREISDCDDKPHFPEKLGQFDEGADGSRVHPGKRTHKLIDAVVGHRATKARTSFVSGQCSIAIASGRLSHR